MPKGWKGVILREEVYNKAKEVYQAKKATKVISLKSFTDWLNGLLWEVLEEDELLYTYAPSLQYIGNDKQVIYIKDQFEDRIVEVEVHDEGIGKRFMHCRYCNRDDCLHVGFCFAVREVNRILVERGFKQPRVKQKEREKKKEKEEEGEEGEEERKQAEEGNRVETTREKEEGSKERKREKEEE